MAVINGFLHPDLEFIDSRQFRNGHLWEVRKKREPQACRRCGLISNRRYGRVSVRVRERPIGDRPLWLQVHKHRYYCESCKKPFTELTPGTYLRRRSTQRFRKHVKARCQLYKSIKDVCEAERASSGYVYQAFYEQLEVKTRELWSRHWPKVLGIDEHFFTRRRGFPEYVTVFTDLKKRKLFEVCFGKSKTSLMDQLKSIPGRDNVQTVCIDLAPGYRSLVKELFPNAKIVADKFHVLKLLGPEMMKGRATIRSEDRSALSRGKLLCRRDKLDYWARSELDHKLKKYPELNELYRAKEKLHQLYRCKGLKRAYQCYRNLVLQLEKSHHPRLKTLLKTVTKWRDQILNYFINPVTNGLTEAINRNAKALQNRARGYRQFKNYRLALLNACAF